MIKYFAALFLLSTGVYLAVLVGLYIPSKNRYIKSFCSIIGDNTSTAILQCKKVIFNKLIQGECFYDIFNKDMVPYISEWGPLLTIAGIIFLCSFLMLLASIFFLRDGSPKTVKSD